MLLWSTVKKHMTAPVHLTLTQHCRWGAGRIQQTSTASYGKSILWVFCLGSGPVFCCFCVLLFALFFRWRNASLAGGFAGRRVLLVFVVVCYFNRFA